MEKKLIEIHSALGISESHLDAYQLPLQYQPKLESLQVVDIDFEGKAFILVSTAAKAWTDMKDAARADQIILLPFSGFRSYLHQKILIDRHLKNGRKLEDILTHTAIPGYSEHHTGRAIDVHTRERAVLEKEFEATPEFEWLSKYAGQFNFRLTYPRGNSLGIVYEPWHWFYAGDE